MKCGGPEYGYVVLLAGFCVHLCLGTANSWGNISTYVTSYLRAHGAPSATYAESFWVFGALNAAQAVMVVLGGFVQMRLGTRITCVLGAGCVGASTILSFYTVNMQLSAFALTYGVLFGFGVGTAYTCPMVAAIRYMPSRKGLVNGVITLGFGSGAFIFNFLMTWYLNPHSCQPVCEGEPFVCPPAAPSAEAVGERSCTLYFPGDSDVVQRVPSLFLMLGCIYTIVAVVCGSLVVPPSDEDYDAMEEEEGDAYEGSVAARSFGQPHLRGSASARTRRSPDDTLDGGEGGLMSAVAGEWSQTWRQQADEKRPLLSASPQKRSIPALRQLNSPKRQPAAAPSRPGSVAHSHAHSRFSRATTVRERADDAASCAVSWMPQNKPAPEHTVGELVCSAVGWQLWMGFFCSQMGATYIVGQFKMHGQKQPWSSDSFEQLVSSMMAVASGVGSCTHGIASDRIGFSGLHVANTGLQALVLLSFSTQYAVSSPTSWMVWCCASAFCFGGNFSVFPTATCALAGRENFGTNYGFVFTGFGAQSLTLALLGTLVPELGFTEMTRIGGALAVIALINAVTLMWRESEAEDEGWIRGAGSERRLTDDEADDGTIPVCGAK